MPTISVPVPVTVCDCGHPPTQTAGIGTGYARDSHGKSMCYDCAAEAERREFRLAKFGDPPMFAYVHDYTLKNPGVSPLDSRKVEITSWPGSVLGRGYITARTHGGFGAPMHTVVATIEGRTWHGRYYPQAGDYVRLRLYKNQ